MKVSVSILSFFKFSFHGSRRLEAIPLLLSLLRLCSFKGRCHQRHITLWHGWRKMRPIGKDVLRALWSPSIPIREPSSFKWFFHTPPSHHYQPYICQKEKARHFSGWVLFTKYFPPQFTSYWLTIDPNILLQLMEWLGGLARTADPSLASHAVSCLPVSPLPTHPTNQCLPACAPTEASLERSCLPLVGRLLMFVATLPNLNNLIELNTLHRRSTAAARTNSGSQCVLHNQYNHTPSTRYRSAGNLLCVSVELLQTSPWPRFALAAGQALPSCWFKWHTAGHLKSDGHFVTLFRPHDHFAPFYCCFSLPATHCFLFVRLCSHMTWTW